MLFRLIYLLCIRKRKVFETFLHFIQHRKQINTAFQRQVLQQAKQAKLSKYSTLYFQKSLILDISDISFEKLS